MTKIVNAQKSLSLLLEKIADLREVQSIGISGSPSNEPGDGDNDIFIYCSQVPGLRERQLLLAKFHGVIEDVNLNALDGGHWGQGDFLTINGVETWLMYFTIEETLQEVGDILAGKYPDKLDNYFYPVGRIAMFQSLSIIYDQSGFLESLKGRVFEYPDELATRLIQHHLTRLEDTEDLDRAVLRKDVLFYHFALDLALDSFLQALFALNRTYFPSRKRTVEFIEDFKVKPEDCSDRLLEVVKLGGSQCVRESYEIWKSLVDDLNVLCQ